MFGDVVEEVERKHWVREITEFLESQKLQTPPPTYPGDVRRFMGDLMTEIKRRDDRQSR